MRNHIQTISYIFLELLTILPSVEDIVPDGAVLLSLDGRWKVGGKVERLVSSPLQRCITQIITFLGTKIKVLELDKLRQDR